MVAEQPRPFFHELLPGRKLEQQTVFMHILTEINGFELFFTKQKVIKM